MSTFEERRRARAAWPIRRIELGAEALTDERVPDDLDARVAMVALLTRAQWELAGNEIPHYTRAEMPGVVRRPPR